uniref:Nucleoporin NDC1 n=1 Tax=Tetraselmis sp. GSL018 TaxID=582737 RepID=A0A061RGB8_9CHLO|mmetsp:Transcript_31030/g.73773  ORF Transcript_31030/g.73773 Transcript_31030/m.73773 type:complete len:542 (+) Transcript_31030:204-1829(+)
MQTRKNTECASFARIMFPLLASVMMWAGLSTYAFAMVWQLSWVDLFSLRPWRALRPLLALTAWVKALFLCVSSVSLIPFHINQLRTSEPAPLFSTGFQYGPAGALPRVLARLTTFSKFSAALGYLFLLATWASGYLTLSHFSYARDLAQDWRLGASHGVLLGLVYGCKFFLCAQDVLSFPIIQRARVFRFKQRLPGAAATAARIGTASAAASVAAAWLMPSRFPWPSSVESALLLLLSSCLLAFCWEVSSSLVEIGFTERVRFDRCSSPSGLEALVPALGAEKEPVVQELAFLDLCLLAEQRGSSNWLRDAVFSDERGSAWASVTEPCLKEVNALTSAIAGAFPQQQGKAGGQGSKDSSKAARWNAGAPGVKAAGVPGSKQASVAALLRSRHHRAETCVRALSALVAASRSEDRYGVAQLCRPSLGDCLAALLSALGALRQYIRLTCSAPSRCSPLGIQGPLCWVGSLGTKARVPTGALSMQVVEQAAYSLEDVLRTGIGMVGSSFGDALPAVLESCNSPLVFGSKSDIEGWLRSCTAGPF